MIEHLENPVQTLIKLQKYSQDGGLMIITTPTPKADKILTIGSKIKLFSREHWKSIRTY